MNRKNLLLALSSSCLLITALSGCGGTKVGEDEDPTKANITVATLDKGIGTAWLSNAAKEFEELYKDSTKFQQGRTGVKIHISGSTQYDGSYIANSTLTKDIYFTEGIPYHEVVRNGKLEDITSVVEEKLTTYGESKSIKDKIDESFYDYLTIDGKVYGVPFYDSFYGLVYDLNLWDEESLYISKSGTFTNKSGQLSVGSDNIAGTLDDGLPATYQEFDKLFKQLRDKSITPFVNSSNGIEYTANYLYNVFADYSGVDEFNLNITLDGVSNQLVDSIDSEGNITYMPATQITNDNGYMVQKQVGRYKTLSFLADVLLSSKSNYITEATHTQAQASFVNNKEYGKPIAMIVEGSWWENEARNTIASYESKFKNKTNYAIMPIPFADETRAAECDYKHTYLSLSQSFGIVSKSSQNKKLAFEFLKFLHTDKMLTKFTKDTSMTRPFNYEISEEDQANLSTYAKSLIDLKKNSNVIYPYSSNQLMIDNNLYFNAFNWMWNTTVNDKTYRHPWMYFVGVSNPSVLAYFNGQYDHFEKIWRSLQR